MTLMTKFSHFLTTPAPPDNDWFDKVLEEIIGYCLQTEPALSICSLYKPLTFWTELTIEKEVCLEDICEED